MSMENILKHAEELSLEARAEPLLRLEQGMLEAGWEPEGELSDEMKALLDEREADADANPGVGFTLEEVIEYVRRKR